MKSVDLPLQWDHSRAEHHCGKTGGFKAQIEYIKMLSVFWWKLYHFPGHASISGIAGLCPCQRVSYMTKRCVGHLLLSWMAPGFCQLVFRAWGMHSWACVLLPRKCLWPRWGRCVLLMWIKCSSGDVTWRRCSLWPLSGSLTNCPVLGPRTEASSHPLPCTVPILVKILQINAFGVILLGIAR